MIVASLLSWWYGKGWVIFLRDLWDKLRGTADFFSIGSLLSTMFAPYRQISAHSGFIDRLISRLVGAVTRFFIVIFGLIVLLIELILSLVLMVIWPMVPLLPIACVVLTVGGVA